MGKIALLVPRYDMLQQAHNIQQENDYGIEIYVTDSNEAVSLAKKLVMEGVSIIIARGLQASRIKQALNVPLVEIVVTAQEMALMVSKAKQVVKKKNPVIAVTGLKNMYCDMSYFDVLYNITLRTYFSDDEENFENKIKEAIADKPDIIIGGNTAIRLADEAKVPSLFISTTEDSLKVAFLMARRVDYAMNVEKKNAAQMEAIFDYSYNGIVQADDSGSISAVNFFIKDVLKKEDADLVGRQILDIFPDITQSVLDQVLKEGKEQSIFMKVNGTSFFTVIAPVLLGTKVDGILMTCHKMAERTAHKNPAERNSNEQSSYRPFKTFDDFTQNSLTAQKLVRTAKLFSISDKPILIYGEVGTDQRILAQSIHNNSLRSRASFMHIVCSALNEEQQNSAIFGEKGAAVQTDKGTLVLEDVEALYPTGQSRLATLIRHGECWTDSGRVIRGIRPRIIALTKKTQKEMENGNCVTPYLFQLLTGLDLHVMPLSRRAEDLKSILERRIRESCERYKRYHVLTAGAWNTLMKFDWKGNDIQIANFCERLILTAEKRSLDEIAVSRILRELYPFAGEAVIEEKRKFSMGPEEARIRKALSELGGSREKTAEELGISKATLWRKMKKYEIE